MNHLWAFITYWPFFLFKGVVLIFLRHPALFYLPVII